MVTCGLGYRCTAAFLYISYIFKCAVLALYYSKRILHDEVFFMEIVLLVLFDRLLNAILFGRSTARSFFRLIVSVFSEHVATFSYVMKLITY